MDGFLVLTLFPPPPLQKFQLSFLLSFKNLAFETPHPPLEFPMTTHAVGMGISGTTHWAQEGWLHKKSAV